MRSHAKASPTGSSARGGTRLGRTVRGAFATRGSSGDADGSGAPSRRTGSFATLALAIAALLAIFATPAGAAAFPEHTYLPELAKFTTGGATSSPCGVATDSAGNYYVADSSINGPSPKSITIYEPDGTQILSFSTTPFSSVLGICKIAVDSSGRIYTTNISRNQVLRLKPNGPGSEPDFPPVAGTTYELDTVNGNGVLVSGSSGDVAIDPSTQNVYVSSKAGNEVQDFLRPAEAFTLKCEGKETASLGSSATTGEIAAALEAAPVECKTVTVAETSGRLKVTFGGTREKTDIPALEVLKASDSSLIANAWQVFNGLATNHITALKPDGTPISNTVGSSVAGAEYIGIDVYGKNGNVYAADKPHSKALVFSAAGTVLAEFDGSGTPGGTFDFANPSQPDLAVDQSNGHVYVSNMKGHGVVDEFDGAGGFVSELSHSPAFEEATNGNGIAVDNGSSSPGKGRIYLTARTEAGANRGVFAFGPLIYGFPLKVKKTGLGAGTVTSDSPGIDCGSSCEAEFESGATITLSAQADPGSVFAGWSGCDTAAGNECEVKLEAAREVSALFDSRPVVGGESASQITDSSARLEALVNPKGKSTSYRFEYLTEQAWEENGEGFAGPNAPSKAPASAVPVGSGVADIAVAQKVSGLEAATAYRFRVVATSSVGTTEGSVHSFVTYSPPDVFAGCANEAFRSGESAHLPDCRAYEQASAVDKNGGNVQGMFGRSVSAAPDGSAISFENPAGLPGGVGAQNFPTFVAKRDGSGWTTQGLLPDPGAGVEATVLGWTPDFSSILDSAGDNIQGRGLFVRSTIGDPLTEVVPYPGAEPGYYYGGASADASTVVFGTEPASSDVTLKLHPADAEGRRNLYAWDRDSGEVHLAGVLPDGSTPLLGSRIRNFPESYDQDRNAVGEDGSAFFTDLTDGKLYLRLNPTADETTAKDGGNCIPDPVFACTVPISASQKENGKGSGGRDATGTARATLHHASPDGSTVIFSSSEKLTDDAYTGPEPEAPGIARAKASDGSEKDLEFLDNTFADQIDIDETGGYVYWTDPAHDRIGRARLDGSEVEESLITGLVNLKGIAVVHEPGDEHIYWTAPAPGEDTEVGSSASESGFEVTGEGRIGRADLDGQNPDLNCLEGIVNPHRVDANSQHLYWVAPGRSETNRAFGKGDVGKAGLDCNESSVVQPFVDEDLANGDITVDGTHFYFSSFNNLSKSGFIVRFDLDGTNREVPASFSGASRAVGLASDASHLYWSDFDHDRISRSDRDGISQEPSFIPAASHPSDLALDADHIYWAANQGVNANPGNDLYEFDRESGELRDLAVDSTHPEGVDVQGVLGASEDGMYVYFAANGVPDELSGSPNANGEDAALGNCIEDPIRGNFHAGDTGTCNLYVAHEGEVTFISRLNIKPPSIEALSGDGVNWMSEVPDFGQSGSARVSVDGKTLLFRSQRRLTDYDNQGSECLMAPEGFDTRKSGPCLEFYLYRVGEPGLACISCVPTGAAPSLPARLGSATLPVIWAPAPAGLLPRNLSSDGRRIFFESYDPLVAADTNGYDGCPAWGSSRQTKYTRACGDVYEWEAPGKGACRESSNAYSPLNGGCIYLLSSGKSDQPSFFGDASEDGDDAFIFTYDRLVPQDEDALMDAYAVSSGGGLPSQHAVATPPCEGEACKGQTSQAPGGGAAATATFQGQGNRGIARKPPKGCPKGKRKVTRRGKTRCVKVRHRHHRSKRGRAADTNRRAGR